MKSVVVSHSIGAGKIATVVGGEDITVFLDRCEGAIQTIEVAVDRDEGGLGPVARWYRYARVMTYDTVVVPLAGSYRYVRVVSDAGVELPFSFSGRYAK